MCPLYEVGSLCTTQCESCGTLCEAFPITDVASAELYMSYGCTIVVGDLYIMDLPNPVTKKVLYNSLQAVKTIRGGLYFKDNAYRTALTFLSNLESVYGVYLSNNPSLVDARMPALKSVRDGVFIDGCDRLCPARYTAVGASPDDSECTNQMMEFYFYARGDVSQLNLQLLGDAFGRLISHLTNNTVCPI